MERRKINLTSQESLPDVTGTRYHGDVITEGLPTVQVYLSSKRKEAFTHLELASGATPLSGQSRVNMPHVDRSA